MNRFFSELQRRHVFRVAAGYAAVAFVIAQVADIAFPALRLPPWTLTLVVVLLLLGFPVALLLAWAFDVTSEGVVRAAAGKREVTAGGRPAPHLRWVAAALVLLVVTTAVWLGWKRWAASSGGSLDMQVVAVLPFRVAGAESSLAYLREGMLDLLAAKLTGEAGPRAVDPHTLTSAWRRATENGASDLSREEALTLSRRLGAGQLVLGEVVSMPGRIVLTASLSHVASGRADAPVSVEGPLDSLPALVDRLVAGLLSVGAGEGERLASLTSASLPALRSYLEGQADYRSGRYDEAFARFRHAMEIDSTFTLAALMTWRSSLWALPDPIVALGRQALETTWQSRERLGPRDRAYLVALAGPRYPDVTPTAEWAAAREALAADWPDSPAAWFERGDVLLHWGSWLDLPDSVVFRRSIDAFDRALALDSMYLPALGHLFDIALIRGDPAAARRYGTLYLARVSAGLYADGIRSALDAQARSGKAMPDIIARVDSAGGTLRRYTLFFLSFYRETLPQAFALAEHFGARTDDPEVIRDMGPALVFVALNRGRPADAERYLSEYHRAGRITTPALHALQIRNGLFGDGDPHAATQAAAALAEHLDRAGSSTPDGSALCATGQWAMHRGDFAGVPHLVERLRSYAAAANSLQHAGARLCAELLQTWHAAATAAPDASKWITRLDSLVTGDLALGPASEQSNLVIARLLEERGDHDGALRALGRYRVYAGATESYRSTFLRERGRLAALVGDTAAAVEAYRFYLSMRADPEPRLRPEVEQVRTELVRLTRGR